MSFIFLSFLLCIGTTLLTWIPKLSSEPQGILSLLPTIYEAGKKILLSQGLSLIIFAFFIYALFQSQSFQALFVSQRKWLKKRRFLTIALITISAALISSSLSLFDEFIYFYPLLIPLFLSLGFDNFSTFLCLYGGSLAGLFGVISSGRMLKHFKESFESVEGKINYTGNFGIGFRITTWILFVTITVLFNLWYSSRNTVASQKTIKSLPPKSPKLTSARKFILVISGFFLLGSIFAQIPSIARKLESPLQKIPPQVSSELETTHYKEVGEIGQMRMAKVEKKKEGYWGTFGNWGERSLDCWFLLGGIIICLVAKLKIFSVLIKAAQRALPLILINYILTYVPVFILQKSGMTGRLTTLLSSAEVQKNIKYIALLAVFGLSLIFSFLINNTWIAVAVVSILAPTLLNISEATLLYAALFAWMGHIVGSAYSPTNGILMESLEENQITYRRFLKKIWKLGLILFLASLLLILVWSKFIIK
ncbi:MAG: hypothetical protein I3273_00605 [Candidatus Moeniiplasma glomeromycotorum]|nr:hypothetical protein [Candidatus Moeniiplasma glomeromycotorum]MCE8167375.1 hypothetical protein [Candidatus Moeniiplasma glomeromycotorum]MCE8168612.1 hypothetical protein [Candidatus Moeniiplasma glomeromycotorum]